MGWWRLRLTAKNLAFLRLTVSFFPLQLLISFVLKS